MPNFDRSSIRILATTAILSSLSACGWVDSTGVQGSTGASSGSAGLANAQAVAIIEEVEFTARLLGEGANVQNWTWTMQESDARERCAGLNGFDTQLAATTLHDACTNPSECSLAINESNDGSVTQFTLAMPKLRSPVAIDYLLTAKRDDGAVLHRQQLLCGLSINEAPTANNDNILVTQGEIKVVNASHADNLLNNDSDDDDVRNQNLRVLLTPIQLPNYAAQFSLDSEGGFIYQPIENTPTNDSGFFEDSFEYAVTDGIHTVSAIATIRIVASNQQPTQLSFIPDITVTTANGIDDSHIQHIDLSKYFVDPDGDPMDFFIDTDSLPYSGNIALSSDGVLELQAEKSDLGQWPVTLRVSDGLDSVSNDFWITVNASVYSSHGHRNKKPTVTDIRNRVVKNAFNYDVSKFFRDADGDTLKFSAVGLPADVYISKSGNISGKADDRNHGTWFIRVTANDGNGGSVTDGFLLIVNSR